MPRYIDADFCKMIGGTCIAIRLTSTGEVFPVAGLDEIPSADVRENVRGEWTLVTDRYGANGEYVWKCSSCNKMTICKGDFCPNCGADMRTSKC